MTDHHPITPPPELVEQWRDEAFNLIPDGDYPCPFDIDDTRDQHIATQAARWGSDQELEACCHCFARDLRESLALELRARRRPKPPSLKEQALMALEDGDTASGASLTSAEVCIIRRALESIHD